MNLLLLIVVGLLFTALLVRWFRLITLHSIVHYIVGLLLMNPGVPLVVVTLRCVPNTLRLLLIVRYCGIVGVGG